MNLGLEAGKQTLDLAVTLGVRGVPIHGGTLVAQGVEAVMAPLRQRGLMACQINAFGWNPLAPDGEAVERERRNLEVLISLAPETGCRWIMISPGNAHPNLFGCHHPLNDTPEALDIYARGLEPLLALAEAKGVCLTVEPYLKGVVQNAGRFLGLHRRVPSPALRCNLDVSSSYDYRTALDPMPFVRESCAALAGHYGLVHLKEVTVMEGFHIHMGLCPMGRGNTDWAELLHLALPHLNDDAWVIVEHVADEAEARESLRIVREAAAS
jgi:sugar phosphate isomerase/epimerase